MTKQTINIGTVANDGTGDPIRTAMTKANENFTELYDATAAAQLRADDAYDLAAAGGGGGGGGTSDVVDVHAGHRGWRIVILDTHEYPTLIGGGHATIGGLAFYDRSGTLIPATGGIAYGTNTHTSYPADNAFDGSDVSLWSSQSPLSTDLRASVGYIFAAPVDVGEVRIRAADGFLNHAPCDWAVQYSDDLGESWTTFATFAASATYASGATHNFTLGTQGESFSSLAGGGGGSGIVAVGARKRWRISNIMTQGERDDYAPPSWKKVFSCAQIEMRAAAGGPAQTPDYATASPPASGTVAALYDGVGTTIYATGTNDSGVRWVEFQYAADKVVREIAFKKFGTATGSSTHLPVAFDVEVSDLGVIWTKVARIVSATSWVDAVEETQVFPVPVNVNGL